MRRVNIDRPLSGKAVQWFVVTVAEKIVTQAETIVLHACSTVNYTNSTCKYLVTCFHTDKKQRQIFFYTLTGEENV
jgi:hypothetical protein